MLWVLLPLVFLIVFLLMVLTNQLSKSLLIKEYESQRNYVQANAENAMSLIDAGFSMLDKQLEKEMTDGLIEFKRLYESTSGPVNLESIKEQMGNTYDLILIDEKTAIIDSTMPEALGFSFSSFDAELGEKINAIRLGNDIVHEKIRTNVATGLLTKFSYVSADDNNVILEIVYNDAAFSALVKRLDPVDAMNQLANSNPNVMSINVYDVYGYQVVNSGENHEPTPYSLDLVSRAIEESMFEIEEGDETKRVVYISDKGINPLSDHSRIIEITFTSSSIKAVLRNILMIVLIAGFMLVLVAVFLIYSSIGRVTSPITKLSKAAQMVADGNYDVKVSVDNQDEIGKLTEVFNTMIVKVNNAYSEIESKFRTTLLSIGDGFIATDSEGKIELMNKQAENLMDWQQSEAVGRMIDDIFILEKTQDSNGFVNLQTRKGKSIPIEYSVSKIYGKEGTTQGQVYVFRDVTDKRDKAKAIEYLSYHDQLTGLLNRRFFEEEMIRLEHEEHLPVTLVMLDVNGLKLINDAFGHNVGDDLLKTAANIIMTGCTSGGTLSRIGGDEFVLLLPNTETEVAEKIMEKIIDEVDQAQSEPVILSISYGIATKTDESLKLHDVFKIAEDVMYRNKLSESLSMRYQMMDVVLTSLYGKSDREREHSENVSKLCGKMGLALGMSMEDITTLKSAGLMHDIGKIAIHLDLYDKETSWTPAERMEIESHSEVGYQLLKSINEFSKMAEFVLAHHENWDGTGYPRRQRGDHIPLESRIIAIANFYDTIVREHMESDTDDRELLIEALEKAKGKQLDPVLVEIFIEKVLNRK
jgi:diguanylate cyclase (GGDEF)-like protein/putative nucleotidyltransferase with HDIG domain/PAS domain S-box-containing protein